MIPNIRKPRRDYLISQIQEHDKQIQCYVEVDYPKTLKELQELSFTELRDWFDRRITELKFLTEDINIEKMDQITKS